MHALLFLHDLPGAVVYAIFMGLAGGIAALACATLAPLLRTPQTKDMLDVAMRTTGVVTAALTLILAFCAVQARGQMADADRLVHAEVAALGSLARLAERIGPPGQALLPLIRTYAASIAAEEFPSMAAAGRHGGTQNAAVAIEDAAYAIAAVLRDSHAADLLEEADRVEAARESRLRAAVVGLPAPFWLLILLLMALVVLTGPLYPPRAHVIVMLAIQSAALGALIAFVFLMEQPFRGELTVSAEPYKMLDSSLAQRANPLRPTWQFSP